MSNFTTLERTMSKRDPRRISQTRCPRKQEGPRGCTCKFEELVGYKQKLIKRIVYYLHYWFPWIDIKSARERDNMKLIYYLNNNWICSNCSKYACPYVQFINKGIYYWNCWTGENITGVIWNVMYITQNV